MSTTLYLKNAGASESSAPAGYKRLDRTQGASSVTATANTVAGPTAGVQMTATAGGAVVEWVSDPLLAAATLSAGNAVTINLYGSESATQANAGLEVRLHKWTSAGGVDATPFLSSERGVELAASPGANNWTAAPTTTSFAAGDRIVCRVYVNDAGGNMESGRTASLQYNGPAAATGDSYVQFVENLPLLRTRTVKSSGGDYTTLALWEAGEQGDLATLLEARQAECFGVADTSQVVIDGWTTSATYYGRCFVESSARHAGVWTTAAGKYLLDVNIAFNHACRVLEDFWRIDGLQIRQANTTADAYAALQLGGAATSDIRVDGVICRTASTGTTGVAGAAVAVTTDCDVTIRNSLGYGGRIGLHTAQGFTGTPTTAADNCVFAGSAYGVQRNDAEAVTLRNCYAHGGTDAYGGTMTRTTCAHSSATAFGGSTASVAYSTATFASVTAGGEDFTPAGGSALIDAGTDLSATFTTDITGATRSGTWDIGAFSAAATSTFTATGALTVGAATLGGSATHTPPTYTAAGTLAAGPATLSGSATFTAPTYTGAASLTAGAATLSAAGTNTAPVYTAAGTLAAGAATLAGSATFGDVFTASASLTAPAATLAGSATHTPPTYTGTAALGVGAATLAASGTFGTQTFTAAAALSAGPATISAAGDFTSPVFTAAGTLSVAGAVLAGIASDGAANPADTYGFFMLSTPAGAAVFRVGN